MKLVVDKVDYGLVPYGPGVGTHSLGFTFKEVDGEYDYTAPKDDDGKDRPLSPIQVIANGLFNDLILKIKDFKLEEAFSQYLLGMRYAYFIGDCMASPEHREAAMAFFEALSHTALELQKQAIAERNPGSKGEQMKVRAPLTGYVCTPKYFSGKEQFYENFNLVVCKLPIGKDATADDVSQIAMYEIGNHNFSAGVLILDDDIDDELAKYADIFVKPGIDVIPPIRMYVVDASTKKHVEIADFAQATDIRMSIALTEKVIEF